MYNDFALLYDHLVFDINYEFYAELIRKCIKDQGGKLDRILDMGVGTGNMMKELVSDAKRYVGIDLSEEMLAVASQKVLDSKVELYHCDIRDFYSSEPFDVCISTLDTTNYILEETELYQVMESIYHLLDKGGLYIFDINSEYKLKEVLGNETYVYEKDFIFYTWENEYYEEEKIVDFILNFFVERDNHTYDRITEIQSERIYTTEEIEGLLKTIGFTVLEKLDFDAGRYPARETQRILFIAKK